MYAIINSGTVENIIALNDECAWKFTSAVKIPEYLPVEIGDRYDGSFFYRNGEKIINPFEAVANAYKIVTHDDSIYTANQIREQIENIVQEKLTDKEASECVSLFPVLKYDNHLIKNGTRIEWGKTIKRAAVDLFDTILNNPENAPALWEDIEYKDGYRLIPEVITAGTLFNKDECGWWKDELYKSLLNNNVWNPDQYPAGWNKLLLEEGVE